MRRTVKLVWTIVCCGRKFKLRSGQTVRCPKCGRTYKA